MIYHCGDCGKNWSVNLRAGNVNKFEIAEMAKIDIKLPLWYYTDECGNPIHICPICKSKMGVKK